MPTGNEVVTVVPTIKTDRLKTATSEPPDEWPLEQCQLVPGQTYESDRGWVDIDGWDVWCFSEPESLPAATDRLRIRGDLYQIVGEPRRYDKKGTFKALKVTGQRVVSP